MSFRSEFADRIKELYQETAIKKKSMDMDWRRIQGYVRTFIEDIQDVKEFACASATETDTELVLAVEGRELCFRRNDRYIEILTNNDHYDYLHPTIDGYCVNYEDKKLLEVIDEYMRAAFHAAFEEMNG